MIRMNLMCKFDYVRPYLERLHEPKLIQGIYFLCDGPKLLYIGSSRNIYGRVGSHLEDKVFNIVFYLNLNDRQIEEIRQAENALITYFKPPLNKSLSWQAEYYIHIDATGTINAVEYISRFCQRTPEKNQHDPNQKPQKLISENFYKQAKREAKERASEIEKIKMAELDQKMTQLQQWEESTTIRYLRNEIRSLYDQKASLDKKYAKLQNETGGLYGLVA